MNKESLTKLMHTEVKYKVLLYIYNLSSLLVLRQSFSIVLMVPTRL